MRLIDADALRKQWSADDCCEHDYTHLHFLESIDSAPTIEERKTGRWIEHDDFDNSWECSSCNEVIDIIDGTPMNNEYRFCPFCGAKMEGSGEDAEKL